ncbi:hypothetical protein EYR40_003725 [Pleurotus pulmonarius]|nr:hypothetical protein EYR40_003725 [Pleurotus pulmonarius]
MSNAAGSLLTPPLTSDDHFNQSNTPIEETPSGPLLARPLSDSESSYFLPSRENGVNDMYLHIGFRAPKGLARRERAVLVWAILRMRHPLLMSNVDMRDYDDIQFVLTPPASVAHALEDARNNFNASSRSKDDLIDSFLNGPRTLSNQRLSYLYFSVPDDAGTSLPSPPPTPDPGSAKQLIESYVSCEWIVCATHFLGDGMALHQFANDYFSLFGSSKSDDALEAIMQDEWAMRWKQTPEECSVIPPSMEARFPPVVGGRFRRAVERIDFARNQEKSIGGHAFPRASGKTRHTIVPTVPFDAPETSKMLKLCKVRGVSISSVMFAICNIAWIRLNKGNPELPMMMYSALNMRPYLIANKSLYDSYWFLAVGYFNVTLPSFLPSSNVDKTFWHRARSAKDQSSQAAKSRMVVSRSRLMSVERGQRARGWAKEDDAKANGTWQAPPPANKPKSSKPPSIATLGLSLLGNLDGMYKHSTYPDIQLHSLTTGSRQRPGGMLLFAYTFAGKLWVSLGYDENGFEQETVQAFWDNVLSGIREFLLV